MPRIMPILSVSALVGSHSERHVLLVVTPSGRHLPRVCVPSFLASFALSDVLGVSALDGDPWRHCLWLPIESPQPFRQYVRPGGVGGPHASKVLACGTGWALNDESTITQPRLSPKTPIFMGCERDRIPCQPSSACQSPSRKSLQPYFLDMWTPTLQQFL